MVELIPKLLSVLYTEAAAIWVILGASVGGSLGLNINENQRPPFGETHFLLKRPLPKVCFSAITIVPCSISFCASSFALIFVESISSK